jgi:hypothetical protein
MPAGSAGYMAPSYGMERVLGPQPTVAPNVVTPTLTEINTWLIVDHNNFAEAKQNQLVDYYINYPAEDTNDGNTWPPFTPSKFPWLVINRNFDGTEEVVVKYQDSIVFEDWKPSAKITNESNEEVDRTYAIISLPEDLGLTQFTETVSGTETAINPADIKVYIKK